MGGQDLCLLLVLCQLLSLGSWLTSHKGNFPFAELCWGSSDCPKVSLRAATGWADGPCMTILLKKQQSLHCCYFTVACFLVLCTEFIIVHSFKEKRCPGRVCVCVWYVQVSTCYEEHTEVREQLLPSWVTGLEFNQACNFTS